MIEMMARAIDPPLWEGIDKFAADHGYEGECKAAWLLEVIAARQSLDRARAALSVLAANVSDEMVAAGSVALPPPDEFGFWKTEDFRRALAAAISAAGDEDRRA